MSRVRRQPLRQKCNKQSTGTPIALLARRVETDLAGGSRRILGGA